MKWAALVTWVLTAGGGAAMLGLWLKHGGMRQSEMPGDRIRSARILGHFALAAAGLVLWVVYLAADSEGLAWAAFAVLVVVALLGFSMLAIWLRQRGHGAGAAAGSGREAAPAERHFPTPIVAGHGVLAAATLVLVLLVAAGVGE
jgi:ABC-type Na+ efflux pump permease subunit